MKPFTHGRLVTLAFVLYLTSLVFVGLRSWLRGEPIQPDAFSWVIVGFFGVGVFAAVLWAASAAFGLKKLTPMINLVVSTLLCGVLFVAAVVSSRQDTRGDPSGMVGYRSGFDVVLAVPFLLGDVVLRPFTDARERRANERIDEEERLRLERTEAVYQRWKTTNERPVIEDGTLTLRLSDGKTLLEALCDAEDRAVIATLPEVNVTFDLPKYVAGAAPRLRVEYFRFLLTVMGPTLRLSGSGDTITIALLEAGRFDLLSALGARMKELGELDVFTRNVFASYFQYQNRRIPSGADDAFALLAHEGADLSRIPLDGSFDHSDKTPLHFVAWLAAQLPHASYPEATRALLRHFPSARQMLSVVDGFGRRPLDLFKLTTHKTPAPSESYDQDMQSALAP